MEIVAVLNKKTGISSKSGKPYCIAVCQIKVSDDEFFTSKVLSQNGVDLQKGTKIQIPSTLYYDNDKNPIVLPVQVQGSFIK